MDDETKLIVRWVIGICITLFFMVCGGCYVVPKYQVWQQEQSGRAELARAEQNRQITIKEAEAKQQASKALAQAEVERARGVAEANKIIGDSLKGNDAYLRYLWVDGLRRDGTQVIYVPTEAGLPILEAGKRD